jgi:hypothetical protein
MNIIRRTVTVLFFLSILAPMGLYFYTKYDKKISDKIPDECNEYNAYNNLAFCSEKANVFEDKKDKSDIYFNISIGFSRNNNKKEALNYIEMANKFGPSAHHKCVEGFYNIDSGNVRKGVDLIDEGIEIDSNHSQCYLGIIGYYARNGYCANASIYYSKFKLSKPDVDLAGMPKSIMLGYCRGKYTE